jgi:hypothetical protein
MRAIAGLLEPGGVFVFDMPSRSHVERSLLSGPIPPEYFGYDHSKDQDSVDPYFFYQALTNEEIQGVLVSTGFELVERVPYGLLKSNMLIANEVGPAKWQKLTKELNRLVAKSQPLREILLGLESSVTKNLPGEMVHGSFVVARKV